MIHVPQHLCGIQLSACHKSSYSVSYLLSGEELNHSLSLKNSISQLWLLYLEINLASSNISTKPVCKNCLSISTYSI